MAIYHLTAKTGTRAGGHSARAKADYIQREHRYERHASDVLHRESGNMPVWATEPSAYWMAADIYERANGRLFKEIEFALPVELTANQQRELSHRFAQQVTAAERLPYSLAIHAGNGSNPHCHLLISERVNDGIERMPAQWFRRYNSQAPALGGSRKTDALKPPPWLAQIRQTWAELANRALEHAGVEARIDHRRLEAQGIERVPQIHLGPKVSRVEQRGLRTDRGDHARTIERDNARLIELHAQRRNLDVQLDASAARDQFRGLWQQHQAEQARQQQIQELADNAAAEFRRQLDTQRKAEQTRERELKRELEHDVERQRERDRDRDGPSLGR